MNKTEEIIKVAQQGGYEKERYYFDENGNWDWEPIEVMLMKPKFYQAIGKQKGWKDWEGQFSPTLNTMFAWEFHAMQFHHTNLTQSFDDAINYLYELIK